MNRTKKAGLSVKSGLSLMCIVCLLCGLLCGFFWLAGESSALAAGPDGSAPAAKTVVSGDVSLAAPERDEKLAVQAAAQGDLAGRAHGRRRHGRRRLHRDRHLRLHARVCGRPLRRLLLRARRCGLAPGGCVRRDARPRERHGHGRRHRDRHGRRRGHRGDLRRDVLHGPTAAASTRPTACMPSTGKWCCRWRIWRRSSA